MSATLREAVLRLVVRVLNLSVGMPSSSSTYLALAGLLLRPAEE